MKLTKLALPVLLLVVLVRAGPRDDVLRLTAQVMREVAEVLEIVGR